MTVSLAGQSMFRTSCLVTFLAIFALCLVFGYRAESRSIPFQWPPSSLSAIKENDWITAFETLKNTQKDFRVESLDEFKKITKYYFDRINDGTEVHRFRLKDGNTIQCILIGIQGSVDSSSIKPESIPSAPGGAPVNPAPGPAPAAPQLGPADVAKLFGLDGLPDENGNVRACPDGSFPQLMPKLENLYHFRKLEDIFRKYPDNKMGPPDETAPPSGSWVSPPHEYAVACLPVNNIGLSAYFNVWAPSVQTGAPEFSLSQLWETGGTGSIEQTAEAGWQVFPDFYGDTQPHLFIYFTTNDYTQGGDYKGCYDLYCKGFMQTNSNVVLGGALTPVSTSGGTQYEIQLEYYRDVTDTGNWWLKFGGQSVGYYPDSLYNSEGLASFASPVGCTYGGEIVNTAPGGFHTTTQMGSGSFPSQGWQYAAYIRNMQYVDLNNNVQAATGLSKLTNDLNGVDNSMYYDLILSSSSSWGQYMFFGGPGRTVSADLFPYQPAGWSDRIVVTNRTGCTSSACTDSSPLYTTDTLYVDWAAINGGSAATSVMVYTALFLDGALINNSLWDTNPPLDANHFSYVTDFSIGSLSAGTHTIMIVADALNYGSSQAEYTKTITVLNQSQSCTYSISSTSQSFGSSGGSGIVGVTAQSGCNWTAVSNASWITITSGASGSGNGTVSYTLAADTTASTRTGTMTVAGQTFTVTQSGAVNISVAPGSLNFGDVYVGQSASQTITITNQSSSAAALTGSVGTLSPPFSVVIGGGAFNLNPGQSVTITVQFSPTTAGAASASLFITHNATNQSTPAMVALSGIGISANAPVISVTPTSYAYGSVKVNRSKSASFTLSNSGKSNLTISSISITGTDAWMFTVSRGGSKTIKPGRSLTIRVVFKPASTGAQSATLVITSNDPVTPTVNIPLTGTGE